MVRVIVIFLVCISVLFAGGCVPGRWHGAPHPSSDIEAPTFCLYKGWEGEPDAKPIAIYRIRVNRTNKIDDEPINWAKWMEYHQVSPPIDQSAWEIEFTPDGKSKPPEKPLACIIYGRVPPGYIEHIPAQPLIPERIYTVQIKPKGGMPNSYVYFFIRADVQGRPIQLEHRFPVGREEIIGVIPKQ